MCACRAARSSPAAPERLLPAENVTEIGSGAPVPAYYDFTPDLLASFPLTVLSEALHAKVDAIVLSWTAEIRASVPAATRLPFEQLADSAPLILRAMAKALGSVDPDVRQELMVRSPEQGITRFQQHYDPRDLMFEDRQLRRHTVRHVEQQLGRRMTSEEQLALGMGLDLMSQQAIVAFIGHQSSQLRDAAEAELRYLSFLSHDLNNNLSGVTLWLQVLRTQLQSHPELDEQVASIDTIQQQILTTIGGMGRLLQAERLRHGGKEPQSKSVDIRSLLTNQTRAVLPQATQRDIRFIVDVPEKAVVQTDPDLLSLVMQNLIGNAAKFASPGVVQIRAARAATHDGRGMWSISVIDDGPGIASEHVERIFQAFQRGTMEGKAGVGLGLAIASRSAALLGGKLTLESKPGEGSKFTLTLPES
jgi:signal transduction histidine kinase